MTGAHGGSRHLEAVPRHILRMMSPKLLAVPLMLTLLLLVLSGCSKSDSSEDAPAIASATATASTAGTAEATQSAAPTPSVAPGSIGAQRAAGMTHGTLRFGGEDRTFRVFIPFALRANAKVPLVVGLHGGLGSGDQFALTSRFESLAQDQGFVAVFPDGIGATWNAGGCCGQASRTNVDDVGFLAALIDLLKREAPIDAGHVFMTGHSNGAMMAFRFGCERPELVKAIAPVAGSLEIPQCKGAKGTNMLAIHGDADQNHPIDGGHGPRSIAGVEFTSMEKTLAMWTAAMGCGGASTSTAGPLTETDWPGCKDGTIARYIVIAGADHPWPGGLPSILGNATEDLDATKTVWAFFKDL